MFNNKENTFNYLKILELYIIDKRVTKKIKLFDEIASQYVMPVKSRNNKNEKCFITFSLFTFLLMNS